MLKGLIKEGLLKDTNELFSSMEKYGCSPNSRMLNSIVQSLFQKGEIERALEFLHKMDELNFVPEASTLLLVDLLSEDGQFHKYMELIPDFSRHIKNSTNEIGVN